MKTVSAPELVSWRLRNYYRQYRFHCILECRREIGENGLLVGAKGERVDARNRSGLRYGS